jgi:hypothetical protein
MPQTMATTAPMTETIDSANVAASTLFLGQNGEFWDFWLIMSVVLAALSAIAIGVTTTGSIVSHKREAASAEEALERYKLSTSKEIAEANARTKESELALGELSSPRNIDPVAFNKVLEGVTPIKVEILYAEACSDCFWLASWIYNFLGPSGGLGWPVSDPRPLMPVTSGPLAGLPPAMSAHAATWGVTVVAGPEPSVWDDGTPQRAVVMALSRSMGKRPLVSGNFDVRLPKDSVRIVVAPKT